MTSDDRPTILYVGPFRLPDGNAAAQRVLANAKALRDLGCEVILAETGAADGKGGPIQKLEAHEGFSCYRLPMKHRSRLEHPQVAIGQITGLIDEVGAGAVIAYNYPAAALSRLALVCHRRGMTCSADITEWYGTSHIASRFGRAVKAIDTGLRMRLIHKRLDALLVISTYLEEFYAASRGPVTVRIPPLVDTADVKWGVTDRPLTHGGLDLVFAGSIGADKERIDRLVDALPVVAKSRQIHLHVVGFTEEDYRRTYPEAEPPRPDLVTFHGRLPHAEALRRVAAADYSVIIRDRTRVTEAGFPTKFVESITLGTPSLVTPHPDLSRIIADGSSGLLIDPTDLVSTLESLADNDTPRVDRSMFDYRRHEGEFRRFLTGIGVPSA